MVENKLVHRDLKLENILIKKSDKGKIIYKLTDYGISKQLLYLSKLKTKAGSLKFMAPEVDKEDKYNQECDLWSLGVIIHVLFFRDYPKVEDNKVNIKSTGNSDLDNLLKELLEVNPQKRLTWNNYFNHSFFKNNIKSETEEEKSNQIIIKLKVTKMDIKINNDIYFLECNYYYQNNKKKDFDKENEELKTLNDENTKIYLDDKPINFCKFFKPTKEGEYKIKIIFKKKILENCSYLFRNCTNIKSIDLSSFDSSKVNNMYYMFGKCYKLEEINLNNFNTEKVTNMGYCFNKCKLLKKIVFPSSFNTKNVQNMEFMFYSCGILKELNFPNNFIIDNVLKMKAIFGKCTSLEKLDLRNFNTSNVKDMSYMFDECINLKEILINPKTFITKNVTNMGHMFNKCNNLQDINASYFEIQNANLLCFMFGECGNLTNLNLSNFKNNNNGEIDMSHMFDKCKNLKILDISSINIENNIKTSEMFNEITNIEKIIVNKNLVNKYKELFKDLEPKFLTN
jgi:surface protein